MPLPRRSPIPPGPFFCAEHTDKHSGHAMQHKSPSRKAVSRPRKAAARAAQCASFAGDCTTAPARPAHCNGPAFRQHGCVSKEVAKIFRIFPPGVTRFVAPPAHNAKGAGRRMTHEEDTWRRRAGGAGALDTAREFEMSAFGGNALGERRGQKQTRCCGPPRGLECAAGLTECPRAAPPVGMSVWGGRICDRAGLLKQSAVRDGGS